MMIESDNDDESDDNNELLCCDENMTEKINFTYSGINFGINCNTFQHK